MTSPTKRTISSRLDDLEEERGRSEADGEIVSVRVDSDGEIAGVFSRVSFGPDGSECERFDPVRPLSEFMPWDGEEPDDDRDGGDTTST